MELPAPKPAYTVEQLVNAIQKQLKEERDARKK
jgi:hypothetical protein